MRFHKLEEFLRTPTGAKMMGKDEGSADFAQLVRDSQKFYVGAVSALAGVPLPKETFPRLPYPMCVFEFEDANSDGVKCSFIALAEELPNDVVRIHSFIQYDTLWLHVGWIELDRSAMCFDHYLNGKTVKFCAAGVGVNCIADEQRLSLSLRSAAVWLEAFLLVLNCSNVEVIECEAPTALNKKRLRNGKVPIYSYKTLVLKTRQQRLISNGHGTHESPRIHLRRGHIKHRKTGDFWWEPCVVGNRTRGMVVKDYRADFTTTRDIT